MVLDVRLTTDNFLEFASPKPEGDDPEHPFGPDIGRIVPPEELYLRELMDLDLTDGQAICEFTRRYGRLETERWGSLPRWYVEDWRRKGDAPELDRIDQLPELLPRFGDCPTLVRLRTLSSCASTPVSCATAFDCGPPHR